MAIFLSAFMVYLLTINSVWATDHATSFLQLDWAIWTHHSLSLGSVAGGFQPNSVDDFAFKGNYYSALAPGTAILALPFVGVGFALDGHFTVFGYALMSSEIFVALCNSVAVYLVYAVGRLYFTRKTSVFLALVFAFSTVSWPFAVYFFQSDVSAMFDLLAVYLTIRATRGGAGRTREVLFAGVAVAAALTVDYVNVVLLPIIAGYLIFSFRGDRRTLFKLPTLFIVFSLIGVVLVGLYNEAIFGSLLRTTEQVYLNSSSPLGEFSTPLYQGVYLNLFSPLRGLLIYTVFLTIGLFGMAEMLTGKKYRKEAVLLLACFLGIFLPYSAWYDPVGGAAFGQRFLVSAIPFLLIPAGLIIEEADARTRALAYLFYAVGVIINGIGGITEGIAPTTNWGQSPLLSFTLPEFLRGGLDDWWLKFVGAYWPLVSLLLLGWALVLPLLANRMMSRVGEPGRPDPAGQ